MPTTQSVRTRGPSRRWAAGVAWALAVAQAGCGGSGGSGGPSGPALTLAPATFVVAAMDPGVPVSVPVVATPHFTAGGTVYVMIADPAGILDPSVALTGRADGTFLATLTTSASLAAGHYTGAFAIHVCPVAACAAEFAGSPVALPYDVQVGTPTNLTTLARINGLGDWETHQRDARHAGYVPLQLDPTAFTTRWRWVTHDAGVWLSPPALANDTVHVSTSGYFAASSKLHALAEADATERWARDFGGVFALNPPAVSGSRLYVATSGQGATAMWSLATADGGTLFSTPFGSQWEHYFAPTVSGGAVYSDGGYYGGMIRVDATSGALAWSAPLAQYDQWTPAVDGQHAYANVGGDLVVLTLADGAAATVVALPGFSWQGWSSFTVPVLTGAGGVLVRSGGGGGFNRAGSTLSLVDLGSYATTWTAYGTFTTDPVVAGDEVLVGAGSTLLALDVASGATRWNWPLAAADAGFVGNLVATDSHVFLSTGARTVAVGRTSHAVEWSYPRPGHKAISANGILYVATTDATGTSDRGLTAVNLR
jgi:PQQ-like domain